MSEVTRARKVLWDRLLQVPHRDISDVVAQFSLAMQSDPEFVGKAMLAMTMPSFNKIRDLGEAGIIVLMTAQADLQILRRVGAHLYHKLEPYRAIRADDFIDANLKPNRHSRKAAERYLDSMFTNKRRFEGALQRPGVKSGLRRMAVRWHVMGKDMGEKYPLAHAALFLKEPIGEKSDILRQLSSIEDPIKQAEMAAGKGLSDQVLSSVLVPHPATIAVRIEAMTPAEALNARGWLEEDGYLNDEDLFGLWSAKAGQAENVSASTITHRKSVQKGTSERVQAVINTALETAMKDEAITKDVGLVIDVSRSTELGIEIAKMFATRIGSRCKAGFMAVVTSDVGRQVRITDFSEKGVKSAFQLIRADGPTSLGAGLKYMAEINYIPQTVVCITDDHENTPPFYHEQTVFADSEHIFLTFPASLTSGADHSAADWSRSKGWTVNSYSVSKDPMSLDQIGVLLQRPPKRSIVEDILSLEWPI